MLNQPNAQLPQDVALLLAEEACRYAQMYIKKSNTQMEVNDLSSESFSAINDGISDHLSKSNQKNGLIGTRDAIALLTDEDHLTQDSILAQYDSHVFISAKYSLGNCGEFAILAMDFLLNLSTYSISAELCVIAGGDHAFLLINRDPSRNDLNGAFICDPWANKIYPAEKYRDELQNYVFDKNTAKNRLEPFDPNRHELRCEQFFNLRYFKFLHRVMIPKLRNRFHNASEDLISVAVRFQDQLLSLLDTYTDNTIQKTILNKCVQTANVIKKIRNAVQQLLEDNRHADYRALKTNFYLALKQIRNDIKRVLIFNEQEAKILAPLIEELKKLVNNTKKQFALCPTYSLTDFLDVYQDGLQKRDVTDLPEELQSLPQAWQISLMLDIAEKTGWLDLSNLRLTDEHLDLLMPRLNAMLNLKEINLSGNPLTLPEYIGNLKLTRITSTETQAPNSSKTQDSSNASEAELSDSSSTVFDPNCFIEHSIDDQEGLDLHNSQRTFSRPVDIPSTSRKRCVTSGLLHEGFFAFPPYPESETSSNSDDETQEQDTEKSSDDSWTDIPFPMNCTNAF